MLFIALTRSASISVTPFSSAKLCKVRHWTELTDLLWIIKSGEIRFSGDFEYKFREKSSRQMDPCKQVKACTLSFQSRWVMYCHIHVLKKKFCHFPITWTIWLNVIFHIFPCTHLFFCFWSTLVAFGSEWLVVFMCLANLPSSYVPKGFTLDIMQKLFKLLPTCHAYRYNRPLPFYTTLSDLDLLWGSQGQHKAEPVGSSFLHTFKLIRMKFSVVLKQFKLKKSYTTMGEIAEPREITVLLTTCIQGFANWFDLNLVC